MNGKGAAGESSTVLRLVRYHALGVVLYLSAVIVAPSVLAGSIQIDESDKTRIGENSVEERNIETMRNLFAAINAGEFNRISSYANEDFVRHDLTGAIPGVEGQAGATDFIRNLHTSIEGLTLEIIDIFGSGDRVAVRFVAKGKHTGELFGMPATGRNVEFNNVNIYRLVDGRISETWQLADSWGLVRQGDN